MPCLVLLLPARPPANIVTRRSRSHFMSCWVYN